MNTKDIVKWLTLAGIFLVPFVPFIVSTTMYFPFITGKGFTFRILVEIISGLYLLWALLDPSVRPKDSWISRAVLFFLGATLIADILGVNPYKSLWSNYERMEGFVLMIHLGLLYFVTSSALSARQWTNFWNTSILASGLMSLYGVMQLAGKIAINQGGVRLDATFGNAAYLAIYLVFHIFLCLFMYMRRETAVWQKTAYGILVVLEVVMLYYTATRGAILGLIGGLFLAGLIVMFKERENKAVRKIAYSGFFAIIVLVGGFMLVRNTAFVQKSPVLSRFASLGLAELHTQGRYYVWPMALKGFRDRPIFGWGQEGFNFVFNKYYDPRMLGQEQWFDRTHDIFLDWLIAGGIVGFAAYFSMYVALLYYVFRKDTGLSTGEQSLLVGLLAAYLFHNAFVFDNIGSYILFFCVLGFIHTLATKDKAPLALFGTTSVSETSYYYIGVPVALILIIGSVYCVNVPAIEASQTLIQAMTPSQTGSPQQNLQYFTQALNYHSFGQSEILEQLSQTAISMSAANVPDTVKQGFYNLSVGAINDKLAQTPNDARYLVFAGSFYNHFGQYDTALQYLQRALQNSPHKQTIMFEIGSSYLGKGQTDTALQYFKEAYDLLPSAQESQIVYALGGIYAGKPEIVKAMFDKLPPEVVVTDNRILHAYADIHDYQTVIDILNARLKLEPNNMQYKLSIASAYIQMGQKWKAVDIIKAMIAADPTFAAQGQEYIKQIQAAK